MSGAAAIFVRAGKAIVASYSRTADGFWIETEPYFTADQVVPSELAPVVLKAMEATRLDVPTPPRDSLGSKLPTLAGVKSYGAFMRGTSSVDISRSAEGSITVTPMRNGGVSGGFTYNVDRAITVGSSLGLLAQAIADGLSSAE